jgi:short-subunit dehydrogenase
MTEQASFAVIPGASSGIGLELARQFTQNGCARSLCALRGRAMPGWFHAAFRGTRP